MSYNKEIFFVKLQYVLFDNSEILCDKFVVENSVEERMLLLQEKKRKLAAGIFGQKPSAEEKRNNRIQDIKDLVDL